MSELEDLIGPEIPKDAKQRRIEEVSRLTQMGLTQQEIGDRLGITQPAVSQLMKTVKNTWKKNMAASYDDYVASEMEHYRVLLSALEAGIDAGSWKHVETAVKLAERRSRLIGLDHSDRMEEVRVRIEATQLDMMSRAFNAAMDAIGVDGKERQVATEALLKELETPQ